MTKKIVVVENYFKHLNIFLNEIKNISLYELDEFNKKFNTNQSWPGKRSGDLSICSPILLAYVLNNFDKFNIPLKNYLIDSYIHLRREKDNTNEWIHKDSGDTFAVLIYLNNTNINSGTKIFAENKVDVIADIKYVQNRAILYSADYFHSGYGHFGEDEKDGRLTINLFIKER